MDTLKVTLVQPDIVWNDVAANSKKYEAIFQSHLSETDLFILPEMCLTGFNVRPYHIDEKILQLQHDWRNSVAMKYNTAIAGSFIHKSHQKFLNQFALQTSDGEVANYSKRHVFTPGGEHLCYDKGKTVQCGHLYNWKIYPSICYDLRFPVWLRNTENYHVLICVANWPSQRQHAWNVLLQARAIENQCYVIGVNRVGMDNNGLNYLGGSKVINPKGEIMGELADKEEVLQVELSMPQLENFRKEFPVLKDKDLFELL